ncbi:hypothetical protein [Commensalibacter sp. Nvir]|uniref:terminase small subunit-like protein n=1 Tax=Commensalibacter sp. Nvir TaxID=3069817 RepID=UPI0030C8850C
MGRSVKYTQSLVDQFCEGLSQGKTLRSLCAGDSMPSHTQVRRWLQQKADFQRRYRQAIEESAENFEAKILEEVEALTADNARVAQIKINTWFKIMGQRNPNRYGENKKSEPPFTPIKTVQEMTDEELQHCLNDTLTQARNREQEGSGFE